MSTDSAEQPHAEATVNVRQGRVSTEILGLAIMVMIQTATIIWWASGINNRVSALEDTVKPLTDGSMTATLARIDERTSSMKDRVNRISDRLYSMPAPASPLPPRQSDEDRR